MTPSESNTNTPKKNPILAWMIGGLLFGILMFLFMEIAIPLHEEEELNISKLILNGAIWLLAGFIWGGLMKFFVGYFQSRKN